MWCTTSSVDRAWRLIRTRWRSGSSSSEWPTSRPRSPSRRPPKVRWRRCPTTSRTTRSTTSLMCRFPWQSWCWWHTWYLAPASIARGRANGRFSSHFISCLFQLAPSVSAINRVLTIQFSFVHVNLGFGDFVPAHPIYMMASIIYLIFGLALTSMCINVVQLKLSDQFRQASTKIVGLQMAEAASQGSAPQSPSELQSVNSSNSLENNGISHRPPNDASTADKNNVNTNLKMLWKKAIEEC